MPAHSSAPTPLFRRFIMILSFNSTINTINIYFEVLRYTGYQTCPLRRECYTILTIILEQRGSIKIILPGTYCCLPGIFYISYFLSSLQVVEPSLPIVVQSNGQTKPYQVHYATINTKPTGVRVFLVLNIINYIYSSVLLSSLR